MRVRVVLVAMSLVATSVIAQAEEEPVATGITSVRLLDAVPNYAEVFAHQWSTEVDISPDEATRPGRHFGLLRELGAPRTLSLQECIALALENNTRLKIQRLDPTSATAGVRLARSVFDPEVFGEAGKQRTKRQVGTVSVFSPGGGSEATFTQNIDWDAGVRKTLLSGGDLSLAWSNNRLTTPPSVGSLLIPSYQSAVALSLNQPLLRDFGWRFALLQVEVAQTTEDQAYYNYLASLANIVTEVERAYWALVAAIQSVRVTEQGLDLAKEVLRQNEGKYKVGSLPHTAVLEAQAEVARFESALILVRNLEDNARDNLRAIINARQPEGDALMMIEPSDAPVVIPLEVDLESSLEHALEQRPELIAARLDVESKKLQRKVAENQLLPRLDFGGSIGVNGSGGRDSGAVFDFNGDGQPDVMANPGLTGGYDRALHFLPDGRFYDYSFGASVEIPLANAEAKATYAQASIDVERSYLSLHQLEEQVTLEIKQAVNTLEADLKSIEATRIARELEEENVRNQQARYDVGLATTKDLLDFQQRLTRAREAEVLALTKYNTDLAELRRVEGRLLEARDIIVEKTGGEKAPWWARF
jgi:outer membrane protein TolC